MSVRCCTIHLRGVIGQFALLKKEGDEFEEKEKKVGQIDQWLERLFSLFLGLMPNID